MSVDQTVRVPVSKCSDDQPTIPAAIYNHLLDAAMIMVALRETTWTVEFGAFSAVLTTDLMVRSTGTEEGVLVAILTDNDGKMLEFNAFVTPIEADYGRNKSPAMLS